MLKSLSIANLTLKHNAVLAPMAGITNLPFRLMCRTFGASLAYTEMISINGLLRDGSKTLALLHSCPDDRPLGVQLFGDSPEDMAKAAQMVEPFADLLDINMGCPVKKVVGTGAGSALLQQPAKIAAILNRVRKATGLPLTIKIRSGWHSDEPSYREIGKIAESEGCDAIVLHPRSRSQMFSGQANWEHIAEMKQLLTIPVIGSGDIFSAADGHAMLQQTGCDGIMVARGALGAPWIFQHLTEYSASGVTTDLTNRQRAEVVRQHIELFCLECGEHVAIREIKKHLGWYARGFAGAVEIRRATGAIATIDELNRLIDKIAQIPDDNHGS